MTITDDVIRADTHGDETTGETVQATGERAPRVSLVGGPGRFPTEAFGDEPWRGEITPPPFDLHAFDRIVASAVRTPAIRMVLAGERVPPEQFCTPTRIGSTTVRDTADARKVLDLYRRGATLVLQSLQRNHWAMIDWCCELEERLGWPVQANAYLTPPNSRGLARHADGHDVLAVQLHGAKSWDVDGLGRFDLEMGQALYVPAGTEHEASTTDRPSLHLTVGIHRPTPDRIASTAFEMSRERASTANLSELADELGGIDPDDVVERLRRPARRPTSGLLAAAVGRRPLGDDTVIAARATWDVRHVDDTVTLTWDDQRLHLPTRTAAMLDALDAASTGCRIGDLPAPGTGADRLVVVRRLLDEGAAVEVD